MSPGQPRPSPGHVLSCQRPGGPRTPTTTPWPSGAPRATREGTGAVSGLGRSSGLSLLPEQTPTAAFQTQDAARAEGACEHSAHRRSAHRRRWEGTACGRRPGRPARAEPSPCEKHLNYDPICHSTGTGHSTPLQHKLSQRAETRLDGHCVGGFPTSRGHATWGAGGSSPELARQVLGWGSFLTGRGQAEGSCQTRSLHAGMSKGPGEV